MQSVLWAGFDAQDDAVPTNAVGIHHPHGDVKRISYVNGTCAERTILKQCPHKVFKAFEGWNN